MRRRYSSQNGGSGCAERLRETCCDRVVKGERALASRGRKKSPMITMICKGRRVLGSSSQQVYMYKITAKMLTGEFCLQTILIMGADVAWRLLKTSGPSM